MVDWEVTATTIYCEDVEDEVTVIVYGDGTVKCSGHEKYTKPTKETEKEIKTKNKTRGKKISCSGKDCPRAMQYRNKLMSEK